MASRRVVLKQTGVFKKCLGCGRMGEVFRESRTPEPAGEPWFTIRWGPAVDTGRVGDQDFFVPQRQVFWTTFYCGYCPPDRKPLPRKRR